MYKDGEEATMMYPLDEQSLNDDIAGRSFHNGRFVQQLRRKAYGNKKRDFERRDGEVFSEKKTGRRGTTRRTTAASPASRMTSEATSG